MGIYFELKFKGILARPAHDWSLVDVQEECFLICLRPTLADVLSLFLYDSNSSSSKRNKSW